MEVQVSKKAPDFTLIGSDKNKHSLKDYLGKLVILYFYPRDNTPGCSLEAQAFRDNHENFKDLNAIILGVSRDTLKSHDKFIEKFNLPFVLLSDESEEVCNLYGVMKDKNIYGKKVRGIERSTFLIDENGILIKEWRKSKTGEHPEEVLNYIKENFSK